MYILLIYITANARKLALNSWLVYCSIVQKYKFYRVYSY